MGKSLASSKLINVHVNHRVTTSLRKLWATLDLLGSCSVSRSTFPSRSLVHLTIRHDILGNASGTHLVALGATHFRPTVLHLFGVWVEWQGFCRLGVARVVQMIARHRPSVKPCTRSPERHAFLSRHFTCSDLFKPLTVFSMPRACISAFFFPIYDRSIHLSRISSQMLKKSF